MKDKELKELLSIMEASGIPEAEAAVYCACLEIGERPVSAIAERAKINRANAYNLLEHLVRRGLAHESLKNNVRTFTVVPLQTLITVLDEKKSFIERQKSQLLHLIPKLQKSDLSSLNKTNMKFFRGEDALKFIFEDTLTIEDDFIYGLFDMEISGRYAWDGFHSFIDDYVVRRKERNIMYHGIAIRSQRLDEYISTRVSKMRVLKYLEGVSLPVEVMIYGDKIAIISHPESSGLIIESPSIAITAKVCFELAWQALPLYQPVAAKRTRREAKSAG